MFQVQKYNLKPLRLKKLMAVTNVNISGALPVTLTQQQMEDAKFDGLFLTFAAREHEKKVARNARGQSLGIVGALRLANEARGGSNPEYKNNDNYDLEIPANYIRNFLNEVKR